MNKTTLLSVLSICFLTLSLPLSSQVLDDPVEVPVKVHAQFNSNLSSRTLQMSILKNGSLVGSAWPKTGNGSAVQSVPEWRNIEIEEDHILKMEDISGSPGISSYTVRVTVPAGYLAWIGPPLGQAIERSLYSASGTLSDPDELVLRVTKQRWDSISAPLGTSPSLKEYDVDWRVSMGTLRNGKSAGWLHVSEGTSIYNLTWESNDLSYSVSSDEVEVINSGGKIKQIKAPQGLAHVIDTYTSDDKFVVEIYSWVDIGSWTGTEYARVSGAVPIYTYTVEKPAFTNGYAGLMVTKRAYTENNATQYEEWRTVIRHAVVSAYERSWYLWDWTTNLTFNGTSGLTTERFVATKNTRSYNGSYWTQTYDTSTTASGIYVPSHKVEKVFREFPWGRELISSRPWLVTNGAWDNTQKVTHEYYNTTASDGDHQQLKKTTLGDGTTIEYSYYDNFEYFGNLYRTTEPFENTQGGKNTDYFYTTDGSGLSYLLDLFYQYETYSGYNKFTFGTDYSYSTEYKSVLGSAVPVRVTNQENFTTLTNKIKTVIKTFREDSVVNYLRDMPYAVMRPDGTQDSYTYASSGTNRYQYKYSGRTPKSWETGFDSLGQTEEIMFISNNSTMVETTYGGGGVVEEIETSAWKSGYTFEKFSAIDLDYDEAGRLTERKSISYTNGSQSGSNILWSAQYKTGLLDNTIDETGAITEYLYDSAARFSKIISIGEVAVSGLPAINDLYKIYTYNASGQVTKEVVSDNSSGTGETIETTYVYDSSGRLTSKTADCCMTVTYTYGVDTTNGCSWSKATNPDGGYSTTSLYRDGQVKSIDGTAVATPQYFDYDVFKDTINDHYGILVHSQNEVISGSSYNGVGWKHVQYDLLSRELYVKEPAWVSESATSDRYSVNHYDPGTGQLVYTSVHETTVAGTEITARKYYNYHEAGYVELEGLDLDGTSGILASSTSDRIVKHEYKLEEDGSSKWWMVESIFDYPDNTTSPVEVSEKKSRLNPPTSTLSEVVAEDAFGRITTVTRTVNYTQALVTDTVDHGAGITGDAVRRTRLGLVQDYSSEAGVSTSYLYDDLRRNDFELGRDDVLREYEFNTGSRRVKKVSNMYFDLVEYEYDSSGRLDYIKKQNDVSSPWVPEETFFQYDNAGRKTHQWGNAELPAKWVYDSYGRLLEGHHYKDDNTAWNSSSFPSGSSFFGGNGTSNYRFVYHTKTHQVASKDYYESNTWKYDYDFTFTKLGQKKTEVNARGDTTTYNYDDKTTGNGTGDLKSIDYPTGMTDEYFYYTRAGRVNQIADATGTRNFVYDTTDKIRIQFELLNDSFYGPGSPANSGKDLEYTWQTTNGTASVAGRDSGVKYGNHTGGTSFSKVYSNLYKFEGGGGRINGLDAFNNDPDPDQTKTFNYEYLTGSNLIKYIKLGTGQLRENFWDSYRNTKYRQQSKWSGTVKADYYLYHTIQEQQKRINLVSSSLTTTTTGYNLASGVNVDTDPIAYNTRGEVTGYTNTVWNDSAYIWDRAGNPTKITRGGVDSNYTADGLNQIEPTGTDSFTYDLDGNLTDDTKYDRKMWYNAKNQLIKFEHTDGDLDGWTYEYKYDYMGRRVEKKSVSPSLTETYTRYVYHGWNLIGETDTSGNLTKSFYWGLDRKSSMARTGGVEALLLIYDHGTDTNYYPIYDTRGNIVAVKNESGGVLEAYDYDAFGKLVHAPASASICSFGFQSKYTDRETGLVYFGHRYYDPETNRWLNRDPIQESGGLNLYAMVGNDPVNSADFLGLADEEEEETGPGSIGSEKCKDSNGNYVDCYTLSPFTIVDSPGRPTPLNSSLGFLRAGPVAINVYVPVYVTQSSSTTHGQTPPGNKNSKTQKEKDNDCLEFNYTYAFEFGAPNKEAAMAHLSAFRQLVKDFVSVTGDQPIQINGTYEGSYSLVGDNLLNVPSFNDFRNSTPFGHSGLPAVIYANQSTLGTRVGLSPFEGNHLAVSTTSRSDTTAHEFGHIFGWRAVDENSANVFSKTGATDWSHSSSYSNIMFPNEQRTDAAVGIDRQYYEKLKEASKPCKE
jgi:RHS repeat-associated protein